MIKLNKSAKISSLIMMFAIFYVVVELIWPKITLAGEYIESKLTASDRAAGDLFGVKPAIQGNTIVVSAHGDDSHTGSAYVFQFDGTNWIEKAKLTASDASAGDRFGRYVDISGNTIVVGAYYDDSEKGSVYVFRFDGLNWNEEAKLMASDGAPGDGFGQQVKINGNTLVANAPGDDNFTGSVYVFRFDGLNWNEEAKLTASDGAPGHHFGTVAVSGDTVLVGAWGIASRTGAAYVFKFDGTSWNEQAKLTASDGAPGDVFGATSIAINKEANFVLIGANEDDSETGSAYIFQFDGTSWIEEAKITASDGAAGDYFGHQVSINGNTLVAAALGDDNFTGSVYVFQFDGVSWIEEAKITASDGAAGDYFGHGLGISGNTILVGAAHDDDAGSSSGSAYVFSPYINEIAEIIGTWSSGIWYWNPATDKWTQMYSGLPSAALAAGDFTGDGKADVASIWSSGLWYQDGDTLGWTQVYHTAPDRVSAGDITGDGVDEIIACGGAWGKGVWYRDVANGTWHHLWSGPPVGAMEGDCPLNDTPDGPIAAGDVTGDGKADMVSCWDSGLWYQDGATLDWTKVYGSAPYKVTCGDVTGDEQAEIISTWSSGIWYWDVAASKWTKMTSYTTMQDIAAGDFTGDGIADVASCWEDYGLWYQDGSNLDWTKVWKTAPYTVTAGDVTGVQINLTEGLIAYYPFNGDADDESGNGYDGIIHGDTSLCKDRFGNSNSAYYFDGEGDYIEIGQEPDIPSWDNYSVSLWFLNDGGGDNTNGYGQKIIDKTVWYHDFYLRVQTYPGDTPVGKLTWNTYEGGSGSISDTSYDYRDSLWHHAVINKKGSYGELWVDGILVGSSNDIKTVFSDGVLLFGYSLSGDYYQRKFWSGKIDDIRLYNHALSETEIKALYNLSN